MTERYQAQTTVRDIRETRGWSQHQYNRFRNAVIDEGKELLLGNRYWDDFNVKPEHVLWRNLTETVVREIIKNLRQKLERDDLESKVPLDDNVLRWKLLPWLRDNQYRVASAGKEPGPRPPEEPAEHQSIEISASEELAEATQPGIAQEVPREESYTRDDCRSRGSSFFDPIKDALNQ